MKKLLLSVFSCFLASVFLFSSAGAVSIEQAQPVMPQITAYVRDDAGELAGLIKNAGNVIAEFYLQNRRSVTMEEISPYVIQGTIESVDLVGNKIVVRVA